MAVVLKQIMIGSVANTTVTSTAPAGKVWMVKDIRLVNKHASTPATLNVTAGPSANPRSVSPQNMSLGPILADSQGRTLYIFLPEKGGKVVCTGACLTYWPLALSKTGASPAGSPGVTGQLGAIDRSGSEQLTYNTWPLYYFAGDSGPDQTKGQGVVGFGGKWLVATPGLQA